MRKLKGMAAWAQASLEHHEKGPVFGTDRCIVRKLDKGTQSRLEMWKDRLFYAARAATCQFDVSDAKGLLELITEIEKHNELLFQIAKEYYVTIQEECYADEFERDSRDLPRVRGDGLRDSTTETENLFKGTDGVYSD